MGIFLSRLNSPASAHGSALSNRDVTDFLVQTFITNVDPLVRVLYKPRLLYELKHFRQDELLDSQGFECLLFAPYAMALLSLQPNGCLNTSPVNCEMLRASSSVGLAVRIAQRVGIRRDESQFNLSPWAVEMRGQIILEGVCNTAHLQNSNDHSWNACEFAPLGSHVEDRFTDMTCALVQYEIATLLKTVLSNSVPTIMLVNREAASFKGVFNTRNGSSLNTHNDNSSLNTRNNNNDGLNTRDNNFSFNTRNNNSSLNTRTGSSLNTSSCSRGGGSNNLSTILPLVSLPSPFLADEI
ncbi:hypothetical protein BJ546DRAFT_1045436 [Cryomyces antarcticus]